MNRINLKYIGAILFAFIVLTVFFSAEKSEANVREYRIFFQTVTEHEDGWSTKWTGCVNLGGNCWSESDVVADCSPDGGQTWVPCNDPE
ncbi:hypothetical protein ACV07N_14550 [Roseivirga echinicomitans]